MGKRQDKFKEGKYVINKQDFLSNTISKLNQKNYQRHDFFKRTTSEQCSIFLQNINISKKKFNFEVFNNDCIINNPSNNQHRNSKNTYLKTKFMENDLLNQDPNFVKQLRENNIEIDGNLDTLSNVETYRNIIREKLKIENGYKKDLTDISQKMLLLKIEKKRLYKINSQSLKDLEKTKKTYEELIEKSELSRKEIDRHYNNLISIKEDLKNKNTKNKNNNEDELYVFKKEYKNNIEQLVNKIQKYKQDYDKNIDKFSEIIKKNKNVIKNIEKEQKILKNNFSSMVIDQKEYYIEILKSGIDVRTEGLVWLVKRLIELNCELDDAMFPKFLDHSQIEYLLKVIKLINKLSYKLIESSQMKTILKILKKKQKNSHFKEANQSKVLKSEKGILPPNNYTNNSNKSNNLLFCTPNTINSNTITKLSTQTINAFNSNFSKYNSMIRKDFEPKIEDGKIHKILADMKQKLKGYLNNKLPENDFFIDKHDSDILKEILIIRQKIHDIEEEIDLIKKEELNSFKRKFESFKTNVKFNVKHDLIYSALFGNNIII